MCAFLEKSPDCSALKEWLPEGSLSLLQNAAAADSFLTEKDLDLLLHYRLLTLTAEQMMEFHDISSDLAQRVCRQLNKYQGFSQFSDLLKTKEITRARIQRGLLHLLLGVRTPAREVPFAHVLGFRREASPLLKEIKKRGTIPLLTKLASASDHLSSEALAFLDVNTRASNIYESMLCKKERRAFVHEYQKPVVILDRRTC